LRSALELNRTLQQYFSEEQIYRVDHYLGKNYVRELRDFRISQGLDWYASRIARVEIVSRESIGIEGRGAYYDQSGATRDVLQNHLLQILALVLSDVSPGQMIERDSIFMALSAIAPFLIDAAHDIHLGQYRGYLDEPGVKAESRTETYIRTHLVIDDSRWQGTEVILETGKKLPQKESFVKITYRDGGEQIFAETTHNKNNAYEYLIERALLRDASHFVRWDSIRAAWQIVNELLHCTDNCPILRQY
jgi:glucose-6-phosphate 1-dehydrogenase